MRRLAAIAGIIALAACSTSSGRTGSGDAAPGTGSPTTSASSGTGGSSASSAAAAVETVMAEVSIPWDVAVLPDGGLLVTERPGRMQLRTAAGEVHRVTADLEDVYAESEGGLLGLALAPDFASSRTFVTCQTHQEGGDPVDVRVIRWRLSGDGRSAERDGTPVVAGLPISSGRHSGCRLLFAPDGTLHVGTGDAAQGRNPQDPVSLGGKTLRVNLDGSVPADNPHAAKGTPAAYVFTSGHRNVQGLALRPGTGQIWSAEHGPDRDDEVNIIRKGANYGWDPSSADYDESVPMTDREKFPDAVAAQWSSGSPTVATSGAAFLTGKAWGRWDGALAVALLKGSGVLVMTLDGDRVTRVERMPQVDERFGRLRALRSAPDGSLYVTTSNSSGDSREDLVLRLAPAAPR
ncbi:MAG: PQQ-dependent sugar dehydrogenase [Micrococcales bacterium]|nr:PQQ-dependent sugar dehydrogenase [Micrococcales bacterium]